MGGALTLLLRLMRLSLLADDRMIVQSPDSLVGDLFGDETSEQVLAEVATALRRADQTDDTSLLLAASEARSRLGRLSPHAMGRVNRATHACDLLIALRAALDGTTLKLHIADAELLRPVQQLVIKSQEGKPPAIIVGGPVRPLTPTEFTVNLTGEHQVEERTEISYKAGSAFPRIHINLPARWSGMNQDAPQARKTWIQHPLPEFDLDVFSYRERRLGRIVTRQRSLPCIIAGRWVTLTFTADAPLTLTMTQLIDLRGRVLIEINRVMGKV